MFFAPLAEHTETFSHDILFRWFWSFRMHIGKQWIFKYPQ